MRTMLGAQDSTATYAPFRLSTTGEAAQGPQSSRAARRKMRCPDPAPWNSIGAVGRRGKSSYLAAAIRGFAYQAGATEHATVAALNSRGRRPARSSRIRAPGRAGQ